MSTSRWPAVVDALVTAATATTVETWDGPKTTGVDPLEVIIVGGTEDPADDGGDVDQEWAGLGAKAKDEHGTVTVAVIVQTGDDSVKVNRDRAFVILGLLETAVRADPTLGGVVSGGWLNVSTVRIRQRSNENGTYCRVSVDFTYHARI